MCFSEVEFCPPSFKGPISVPIKFFVHIFGSPNKKCGHTCCSPFPHSGNLFKEALFIFSYQSSQWWYLTTTSWTQMQRSSNPPTSAFGSLTPSPPKASAPETLKASPNPLEIRCWKSFVATNCTTGTTNHLQKLTTKKHRCQMWLEVCDKKSNLTGNQQMLRK